MADPVTTTAVIDSGSTAWMLTSSALVLLMVPGLALFYGGMVRKKNVLTTMMMSFVAMAIIGVQWVTVGYALAFGKTVGGFFGWDPSLLALNGIEPTALYGDKGIPELVFVMFQGKFAIITPALISGAVAERMRFRTYVAFTLLWVTFIYCPLAHWVWAADGWLFQRGVLDFAGGTVVHISAGVSALVLALMMGPRRDVQRGTAILPNNLVLTLTGAGLLWFGWFGFNAGSAVAVEHPVAGFSAGLAFTTTQSAAAAAGLMWMLVERWHHGKVTSLGLASGIVAGLVAVTPAAGHIRPWAALVLGALASIVCYWAVQLKTRFKYDDSLDAFGVHGVGGILGGAPHWRLLLHPCPGPHLRRRGAAGQAGPRRGGGHRLRRRRHLRHRVGAQGHLGPAGQRAGRARRAGPPRARRARLPPRPGLTSRGGAGPTSGLLQLGAQRAHQVGRGGLHRRLVELELPNPHPAGAMQQHPEEQLLGVRRHVEHHAVPGVAAGALQRPVLHVVEGQHLPVFAVDAHPEACPPVDAPRAELPLQLHPPPTPGHGRLGVRQRPGAEGLGGERAGAENRRATVTRDVVALHLVGVGPRAGERPALHPGLEQRQPVGVAPHVQRHRRLRRHHQQGRAVSVMLRQRRHRRQEPPQHHQANARHLGASSTCS
jgi:Amt family ammonium transporter